MWLPRALIRPKKDVPAEEQRTPAPLQFDTDEISDFGQQVATLLQLQPDTWFVSPSLRDFAHDRLGGFTFDKHDKVTHCGQYNRPPGSMRDPGTQRALTHGDQKLIVDALRFVLTRPMSMETPTIETTVPKYSAPIFGQGVLSQQMQRDSPLHAMQRMQNMMAQQMAVPADHMLDAMQYNLIKAAEGKLTAADADCINQLYVDKEKLLGKG